MTDKTVPPAPETLRATPQAIATELAPHVERIVLDVVRLIGERLDRDQLANIERHRVLLDEVLKLNQRVANIEALKIAPRIASLEARMKVASQKPKHHGARQK